MSMYHELLAKTIKSLEQENLIMVLIGSPEGFYNFYNRSRWEFKNGKDCFDYCNQYYKGVFGRFLYSDFEEFQKENQLKQVPKNTSIEILERKYLLTWFKSKGFNTWTSFKALVMHYYPATAESVLYDFWQNKTVDAETQKNVGYVKQIIGE